MDKYYKALQKHKSRLVGLPNVCGVGVGFKRRDMKRTDKPALIVFVEKKEKWEELSRGDRIPKKIGGLETDVIEIGRVRLLGTRQERHRPAKPGVSIGHYKISAGTFGALVKDVETGERLILSNNHILANGTNGRDGRAEIGDPILQPGHCDTILKILRTALKKLFSKVAFDAWARGQVINLLTYFHSSAGAAIRRHGRLP